MQAQPNQPQHDSGSSSPSRAQCHNTPRRASSQSQSPSHHNAALVRAPAISYDHASLCYFVSRFVSPDPADGYPGHLSFLPGIYDGYKHGLLETATMSVAQMAAYNKFGGDRFKVESYQNYGRAIRMLRDTIQSEDQATDDKVITAILLLCTLKDVSGEESGDPNEHAPGLFYLIEKRGLEQMATSTGSELLFLALIRLVSATAPGRLLYCGRRRFTDLLQQIYAFLHEDDTYVDPGAIATCWGAFDPLLRAMTMMSKTLSLRHKLLSLNTFPHNQQTEPSTQQDYRASVMQGCFETLDEFQTWDAEAASYWESMFHGRGAPTALGQIASTTHYDVETACTIILIRSARLILLMSIIAHIDMAEWTSVLEQEVTMTINDILACVPYALGDINASGLPASVSHDGAAAIMIHQPIRLVASCAYATADQQQKAMDILARMNAGVGIRAAVGVGSSDLSRTRWAREQMELRAKMAPRLESPGAIRCPSLSPVEEDTEASPMETNSPLLFTPTDPDPAWLLADVGCATF